MLNKQAIQKRYFQLIKAGDYIDVRSNESEWLIARVVDKDKRYVYVAYDGWMNKQEQFFINSFRVAPLRTHTQGYTGSTMRVARTNMPKIQTLKNFIQIAQDRVCNQDKANPFQITQLLRGQLFVYVHHLVCLQHGLDQSETKQANEFLCLFVDLVIVVLQKALQYREEYFAAPLATNKLLYLSNYKIALVQSLQELLTLLQLLVRAQIYKYTNLFKYNKGVVSQQKLAEYFLENKGLVKLHQIFLANDKNGRWYPSSVRKIIYKIMLKYAGPKLDYVMPKLPKYQVKDFQQFYSIYPFMCRYSPQVQFESQYVDFSINLLLTNSPFDAKLKSIQELKKIFEGKNQFQFLDKANVISKIDQMDVLEQLLDNKNFNPQVFKRFLPLLNILCKVKSLSLKHIHSLFQIVKFRHESQTGMIFEIISQICQFAPSSLLDSVYAQICKIDINSQQTISFIKTFTVKAVQNLSKQKSYFSGWFGRKKGSSKHGYYGLNILYRQSHDEGRIARQKTLFALNIIKEILVQKLFIQERWNYITSCVQCFKKKKSFGQSIKLIHLILSTYEETSFFAQDRKKIVQKLDAKYSVVDLIIEGFRSIESIPQVKVTHQQSFQYFYELIETFSPFIKVPLKVRQIQYLWHKFDSTPLLTFLRKPRPNQKLKKLLAPEVIEEMFSVIFKKPSFYKRSLTLREFETIYELFISYHLDKQNITLKMKDGLIRYNRPNLLGLDYFINFLEYSKEDQARDKTMKRTIQLILRPNVPSGANWQALIEQKVTLWKQFFKRCIQRLSSDPTKCLNFIQVFYSCIQGRLQKQISTNDTSNIQILVQCDDQQKVVTIQRFSTIFGLRKLIKQRFRIQSDFNLFNAKLNKAITFEEEEDFSVNAMPLVDNGRSVSIKIELKENKLHQQEMSIALFKRLVEKQEKLYHLIFEIVEQDDLSAETQKIFWKTIELLPLNKSMMTDIEKCQTFTFQKWKKYLQAISDSSLQYKLNIILNLIKNSQKWTLKMQQTGGLLAVIVVLLSHLQKWSFTFDNQTLTIKLMEVIERIYGKGFKKQQKKIILEKMNSSFVRTLETQFNGKSGLLKKTQINNLTTKISLLLINKTLLIYLSNLKILLDNSQTQITYMKLQTFIKILDYGLFLKKTQSSQKFSQQVSISLLFAAYNKQQDRLSILQYLMDNLDLQKILQRQRSQNYFKFLITILYSFDQVKVSKQGQMQDLKVGGNISLYFKKISEFVNDVIQSQTLKDQEKNVQQIIYGSLSLLKFLLSKTNTEVLQMDPKDTFSRLINFVVFPIRQCSKRLKTQKNKKILFQILKMISFQEPSAVQMIMGKLRPFLQKNKYRKNTITSWNLQFENSQKKLFVGLQNLGATCYINCLFQQLFMIRKFRQGFMAIDSRGYKEDLQKNQIFQLQKLFYSLKYIDRKSLSTKSFCSSFITFEGQPINPVVQSDADQFFNTLMDRIQTFLKNTGQHDILQRTFEGKLSNQLNCEGCPHRSQKIESFTSIGVNLKNKKTLQQALKGYVQGQILDGDNAYYCEICEKKVRTLKRLCIKELPNILVIVLKRFQYDFDAYKKIKINSYLEFPELLNMAQFTTQYLETKSVEKIQASNAEQNQNVMKKVQPANNNFHLRGAVIHAGNSDAGHYYSFIKDNNKWFQFNDDFINQIKYSKIQEQGFGGDEKDVDQFKIEKYKNAYILFYERQASSVQKTRSTQNTKVQMKNEAIETKSEFTVNSQQKIQSTFSKQMMDQVLQQNNEANIFSSLLQTNFILFWQNLSILQNLEIKKFIILYFHTVVLRDKSKYQYCSKYFRIVSKYLANTTTQSQNKDNGNQIIAQWFLSQINKGYVKEFLVQAPKTIRFVCASLVLTAIHYSDKIPEEMPLVLVSSLRRSGMSPLGLIFRALLNRKQSMEKLRQLDYFKIVLSILLNEKNAQQLNLPQPQTQIQSYLGIESSQFQAQRQKCSSALLQSLQLFDEMSIQVLLRLNELYSFRKSNKVILKKLAYNILKEVRSGNQTESFVIGFIKMFETKTSASNFGKQLVEKYLFFMRYLVQASQNNPSDNKIYEYVAVSFQNFISTSARLYEPMDWIMRELTKISSTNSLFKTCWRNLVLSNQSLKLQMDGWLKEVEKIHCINMKDDFFQKIRQMDFHQKSQYLIKYSKKMRQKTAWMFDAQHEQKLEVQISDFEMANENDIVEVRNKSFKIRQKFQKSILFYVSNTDKEQHSVWAYLQKNQIQTFNNM